MLQKQNTIYPASLLASWPTYDQALQGFAFLTPCSRPLNWVLPSPAEEAVISCFFNFQLRYTSRFFSLLAQLSLIQGINVGNSIIYCPWALIFFSNPSLPLLKLTHQYPFDSFLCFYSISQNSKISTSNKISDSNVRCMERSLQVVGFLRIVW